MTMRISQSQFAKWSWSLLIITVLLSGCSLIQPEQATLPREDVAQHFSTKSTNPDLSEPWWLQFQNNELNGLMTKAISNNLTVRETWARLRQTQAAAAKAGAAKLPDLSGNIGASHNRTEDSQGSNTNENQWSLGITAGYEIDLWGRVEASHKQQQLSADINREGIYTAIMTLSGQVTKTWVTIIALQEQQKLLREQMEINQKLLELLELRFSLARVSLLDIYQQRQTVLSIENSLIPLEAREKLLYHQLAVLVGQPPGSLERVQTRILPRLNSVAQVGVPADLLNARPDLRASRLQLESAGWQVVQARAERLPKLELSLSLTMSAAQIGDLIDNWILKLGSTLAGSLFDGGKSRAEIERTKAVVDEKLATYRLVLLQATQEVEDSLVSEERYHKSATGLTRQITLSDKTLREATYRYLNGLSDFLPVLREQLQSVSLKLELIQTRAEIINSRIDLYKALGGSWIPETARTASNTISPKS